MGWLGIGLSGLAFAMLPVSAVWLLLALWLGRKYRAYGAASPQVPKAGEPLAYGPV